MLEVVMLIAELIMAAFILVTLMLMFAPFVVFLLQHPFVFYAKYMEKYWRWISKKLGI